MSCHVTCLINVLCSCLGLHLIIVSCSCLSIIVSCQNLVDTNTTRIHELPAQLSMLKNNGALKHSTVILMKEYLNHGQKRLLLTDMVQSHQFRIQTQKYTCLPFQIVCEFAHNPANTRVSKTSFGWCLLSPPIVNDQGQEAKAAVEDSVACCSVCDPF